MQCIKEILVLQLISAPIKDQKNLEKFISFTQFNKKIIFICKNFNHYPEIFHINNVIILYNDIIYNYIAWLSCLHGIIMVL